MKSKNFQFYPCSKRGVTVPNLENCRLVHCTIRKKCKVKGKAPKDPKSVS